MRLFISGHKGMAGSALCRRFQRETNIELLLAGRDQLDLRDEYAVSKFFREEHPDAVIFAAARVGGILANNRYPVQFLADNTRMAVNAIQAAFENDVQRFLFLGSTCIYPKFASQPIEESSLLTNQLEETNEAYALAKITGLKLCQYYRRQYGATYHSAMPTNLYGPGDNYHPENSHVLPALLRRFHEAKERGDKVVTIWGTGNPRREFLHVDDLADALHHLFQLPNPPDWVNVGTGMDLKILELARLVAKTVGYTGEIVTDPSKPDGTPRKWTDVSLINSTGWNAKISLESGLISTYRDYLARQTDGAIRCV